MSFIRSENCPQQRNTLKAITLFNESWIEDSQSNTMVINSDMVDKVKERHDTGGRNWRLQNDLIQVPSISPCITRQEEDEDEDEEIEFTLGRLIRQASLNSSQILPPRHTSKTRSSSSITKYCPKKKLDQPESNNMEVGHQYLSNQANIQRRLSDIQTKEVQGFKSFALKYGEAVSKSIVANIIPNFDPNFDPKMLNISSPTMRNWSDKERSAQDMKAQIKFWARAVASNVGAPGILMTKLELNPIKNLM